MVALFFCLHINIKKYFLNTYRKYFFNNGKKTVFWFEIPVHSQ